MKRILLCHDGSELTEMGMSFLYKELLNHDIIDILYVIPQNLIHYGQVDQLATPDSKQEFIEYVQSIGIQECKDKLGSFQDSINVFAENQNIQLKTQLHVRWGDAIKIVREFISDYSISTVLIPSRVWGIDWHRKKKLDKLIHVELNSLHII